MGGKQESVAYPTQTLRDTRAIKVSVKAAAALSVVRLFAVQGRILFLANRIVPFFQQVKITTYVQYMTHICQTREVVISVLGIPQLLAANFLRHSQGRSLIF